MSNYYDYRDVKVAIAHKLMAMDGWKVYGYSPDNSDPMTDYYDPANWGGVAEKNGYILCVDVYGAAKPYEIREYNAGATMDAATREKIAKLENMTTERGASESEAATAREKIAAIKAKIQENQETGYVVTGIIPGHMEHPARCNWHIEKDGVIIEKGNGLLKFSDIADYFTRERYSKDMADFRKDPEKWERETAEYYIERGYYNEENAIKCAKRTRAEMAKKADLIDKFNAFINKIDTACGGLLGDGDGYKYEKIKVTEYKKELRAVEKPGKVQDGQCFVLKTDFNYGCYKGLVYRIHENTFNGKTYYHAYKLNGKLTKECTGNASSNNHWCSFGEKFEKWIERGAIAFCELEEVNTPYEVEKVVRKKVTAEKPEKQTRESAAKTETKTETTADPETVSSEASENFSAYDLTIEESEHTKTGEKLWLVRAGVKLSKEDFATLRTRFSKLGGYYSKFTHSFIFKEDPAEKLNIVA